MPTFSLKDLLLATTLISIGLSVWYLLFAYRPGARNHEEYEIFIARAIAFNGIALIGAGLLAPFKRTWIGAIGAIIA